MMYTVFSTTNSAKMQWQSQLLEYSWKKAQQEGVLIRLVATDEPHNLPQHQYAQSIATKSWDVHPDTGDHYPIYNKPASLLEWLYREEPDGTVLFIDPDCVFRRPVNTRVAPGHPVSQSWIDLNLAEPSVTHPFGLPEGFEFLNEHCANVHKSITPAMIPTLIHTRDLKRICPRWLELCSIIRGNYRDVHGNPAWETDMYAYFVACAEYELEHETAPLGIITDWQPETVPDAPIVHYCQPVSGKDGTILFNKHEYEAWSPVDLSAQAQQPHSADLMALIGEYLVASGAMELPVSQDSRPKWADGVMEGRLLDQLLLEKPQTGAKIWLNESGLAIWELCDGKRLFKEILRELSVLFEVSPMVLEADVTATVRDLAKQGFLTLS